MRSHESYSDNGLLDLLKQGDEEAFTGIYLRYWDRLIAVAMHRLGNLEEAREIVQNVFLNLWKRRETLAVSYTLHTYLATAVKYEVFKQLATKSRQLQHRERALENWQESVDTTQNILEANELQSQLASMIKALPEKCQIVFRLSRENGYSQKQISQELGIAEKTVEAHLSLALRRLRVGLSHLFTSLFFL